MYNRKYKEITIIVPEDRFGKVPERIEYKDIPYGKMEKAWRLLIRSMASAIDNTHNAIRYEEFRKQYSEKKREKRELLEEKNNLRWDLKRLKKTRDVFKEEVNLDSLIEEKIPQQIITITKRIEILERELDLLQQQVPTYMWNNMYWW